MCYEFERVYWQKRAQEFREEIAQAEEKKKQAANLASARPPVPEPNIHDPEPLLA